VQYLVFGMRFLIGAVFLASTFGKLARRGGIGRFTDSVRGMRILPERLARPVALAVIAGEASVCVLLTVPSRRTALPGLALATALLAVFTVAIALAVRRGVRAPCQCFGASTTPLGARHLVRNVLLVAAAVTGAAGSAAEGPVHPAGALVAAASGLLAGGVVAALDELHDLFASGEPV